MRVQAIVIRIALIGMLTLALALSTTSCTKKQQTSHGGFAKKPVAVVVSARKRARETRGRSLLVFSIAGVTVGSHPSTDDDVVKVFGPGLFTDKEDHGGGRYFTDTGRSITLHVTLGPDRVIDYVELTEGLSLPKELNVADPALVSPALSATPEIDRGLKLGMSGNEIIKILGQPKKDGISGIRRTITYEATSDEDTRAGYYYTGEFVLTNDRLTRISLYDGE